MAELTDKMITFAYLKQECDIPSNIDDQEFDHKIHRAQEMLRMLMGDEFYRTFKAEYIASTLSAANLTLYNPYVKQFIAWQANEYWTFSANFKKTRAGFRVHTEANSEPTSDVQQAQIIKDAKQQAQYYKKLLVDYLDGHSSDYPLYSNYCNKNLTGNTFHISAVKKKHHHNCKCNRCRC